MPSMVSTIRRMVFSFAVTIHSLFDRGYVTVTPTHHFEVSRRIRDEFENGRDYYAMHGRPVQIPQGSDQRPDPEALAWHNENRFLG